jgi:hypothetical protein
MMWHESMCSVEYRDRQAAKGSKRVALSYELGSRSSFTSVRILESTAVRRVGLPELVETVNQGLPCDQKSAAASGGSCAPKLAALDPPCDGSAAHTEHTGDLVCVRDRGQLLQDDCD